MRDGGEKLESGGVLSLTDGPNQFIPDREAPYGEPLVGQTILTKALTRR